MTARKSFFLAAAGQFFVFIVSFAGSIVVARLLTPEEVGTYVLGAAFAGVCAAATAFNIGAFIIGETDLSDEVMDSAFTLNALLAVVLSTFLFAASFFSGLILGSVEAGRVMVVLAAQPILAALAFRSLTMLSRNMQFGAVALINMIAAVAGASVTVVAALAGQSFMSQAWGTLTVTIVSAVGFAMVGARYVSFRCGLTRWREIAVFGGRMTTISGAAMGTARLSEIVIGRMLGLHTLGIFSRASNLSNQMWDNVYGVATRVAFAQLSKDYRETGELKDSFLRTLSLISGIMCPALAGLAVLSPYVINLLYGSKWLAAAVPFSILLFAQIIAMGFGMNWELFVIRRETGRQTTIELVRNAISLVTVTIGAFFSLAAASAARVLDNLAGLFLYRKHVLRLSGVGAAEYRQVFARTGMLTLVAVGPAAALMIVHRWSYAVPHVAVAAAVLAGVIAWLALLRRTDHPLGQELGLLVRKALSGVTRGKGARNA